MVGETYFNIITLDVFLLPLPRLHEATDGDEIFVHVGL
jgi:hypothetical protein